MFRVPRTCCVAWLPLVGGRTQRAVWPQKKGELLLCDGCPRAFHLQCLKLPDVPGDEDWFCDRCMYVGARPVPAARPRACMLCPALCTNSRACVTSAKAEKQAKRAAELARKAAEREKKKQEREAARVEARKKKAEARKLSTAKRLRAEAQKMVSCHPTLAASPHCHSHAVAPWFLWAWFWSAQGLNSHGRCT